jgi:hypothetical protein
MLDNRTAASRTGCAPVPGPIQQTLDERIKILREAAGLREALGPLCVLHLVQPNPHSHWCVRFFVIDDLPDEIVQQRLHRPLQCATVCVRFDVEGLLVTVAQRLTPLDHERAFVDAGGVLLGVWGRSRPLTEHSLA